MHELDAIKLELNEKLSNFFLSNLHIKYYSAITEHQHIFHIPHTLFFRCNSSQGMSAFEYIWWGTWQFFHHMVTFVLSKVNVGRG